MSKTKLPFKLDTIAADRHFISIYPENKQWLIILKGTELGDKLCSLLEPSEVREDIYGLWLDKIHGLYQEERQLLEEQIESYYNEKLSFDKFVATVAKALELDTDATLDLLDNPYKNGLETGEKIEPFLPEFRTIATKLVKLETRLNEDAIAVVMRKRFGIEWSKEETEMLHEGMKKALSDFISNEQKGWTTKADGGRLMAEGGNEHQPSALSPQPSKNDTPSQTGSPSSTTSNNGATTPDSTT